MDIFSVIFVIIFLVGLAIAFWVGIRVGSFRKHKEWEDELPGHRKDAVMRSRAVLGGQFSEQLAPYLPDFPYLPTECKFIGKPIDLICFKGMDDKDINEVIFVEVKSGKAKLSSSEKKLKEAIEKKKVRWEEYRVPEDVTK
ncbi:MAG: Holliday junction resolvase-like protein [Nanoarchaeota archaeon]|nr:hypothetical protein [Nanoarchaeota archaeon]